MTLALSRGTRTLILAAAGLVALMLLLLAAFPVSWFKGAAERQLGEQFGSRVHIASLDRENAFSLSPVIRVSTVRIAQANWAGKGEMASIRLLRLRLHLLPLLRGRFDAELLTGRGVRLFLVRAADGRKNWSKDNERQRRDDSVSMANINVEDAVIHYKDALQKRSLTLAVRVDPKSGLSAEGTGSVDGAPVRLRARGGPMTADRPWRFDAAIDGPALGIHVAGSMAGPLRTGSMTFRISARADDLKRVDRVIEAGLFGTQPVNLRADVRHEDATWTIQTLTGTIGKSELAGRLTARKVDGRMKLNGEVRFAQLDFEDLASDIGKATAIALERTEGLKLVPNTRINIRKIDATDGRIAVRVDRVMGGRRPSSITDLRGVLTLDNRILTVEPLRVGLRRGAITGKAVIDQRAGQAKPRVTLSLDMRDSRISALAGGDGKIDSRVDGRVRLTGTGDTIREAVGTSDGTIGVVARSGTLPAKIAALIGFDIGKGLVAGDKDRSDLRCAVLHLDVRNGRGTVDPLLIDTGISQSRGSGTIRFPAETLDITLTGAPKGDVALHLPGAVSARGSVREPKIVVPEGTRSIGTLFKAIGRAIQGKNVPTVTNADCDLLIEKTVGD